MCIYCNTLLRTSKSLPLNIKMQIVLPGTINLPGTFPASAQLTTNRLNIYYTPAKLLAALQKRFIIMVAVEMWNKSGTSEVIKLPSTTKNIT